MEHEYCRPSPASIGIRFAGPCSSCAAVLPLHHVQHLPAGDGDQRASVRGGRGRADRTWPGADGSRCVRVSGFPARAIADGIGPPRGDDGVGAAVARGPTGVVAAAFAVGAVAVRARRRRSVSSYAPRGAPAGARRRGGDLAAAVARSRDAWPIGRRAMADSGLHPVIAGARHRFLRSVRVVVVAAVVAACGVTVAPRSALAQNDWQFPDPYFGVPQPANPAAPSIQRRYRTEIGPPAVRRQTEQPRHPQRWRRHRPPRDR